MIVGLNEKLTIFQRWSEVHNMLLCVDTTGSSTSCRSIGFHIAVIEYPCEFFMKIAVLIINWMDSTEVRFY